MFVNPNTFYYIVDSGTNGILLADKNPVVVNYLNRGMLDCHVHRCGVSSPGNPTMHKVNNDDCNKVMDKLTGILDDLHPSEVDDRFLGLKRVLRLRRPLIYTLMGCVEAVTAWVHLTPFENCETTLDYTLRECYPENDIWTDGLVEYANIIGLEPKHAYRELKLQFDDIQHRKMRAWAFMKVLSDEINRVTDAEQANRLNKRIVDEIIRNAW